MDVPGKYKKNDEKEKCIAHYWKSASNTIQIVELVLNTGIKSVALGCEHCLCLGYNGKVFARGVNKFGQLGLGDFVDRKDLIEISCLSTKNIVHVECGSRHSGVLTGEGHVYCWGDTSNGQCGLGDNDNVNEPAKVYFIDKHGKDTESMITTLAFGELHSLGLSNKGQVWAWGSGCTLGLGNDLARASTPQIVENLIGKKVISIACGHYHSFAITDVENSLDIQMRKGANVVSPDEGDGIGKRKKFSSQIRIPHLGSKGITVERSNSLPLMRTTGTCLSSSSESDCPSTSSDKHSPSKPVTMQQNDVKFNVPKDCKTSSEESMSGSFDAGFAKITDAVMKSVNEVLSYTTSLASHTSTIDGLGVSKHLGVPPTHQVDIPEIKSNLPKVKPQVYSPVTVQLWAWGRGTFGQLGHGTTEDRYEKYQVDQFQLPHCFIVLLPW